MTSILISSNKLIIVIVLNERYKKDKNRYFPLLS